MMYKSLDSLVNYYSPYSSLRHNEKEERNEKPLDTARLTAIELHENSYKIISYGCSVNVLDDQSLGTERLLQHGFPCEGISTLTERGWDKKEAPNLVQDRIVAELTRRIGTYPEEVDLAFLSRRLKAEIPTEDTAVDKKTGREQIKPKVEGRQSPSIEFQIPANFIPITTPTSIIQPPRRIQQISQAAPKSSKTILEQTIQWSTSNEVFFVPLTKQEPPPRKMVVSPRDIRESEYLDDIPTPTKSTHTSTDNSKGKKGKEREVMLEQQKRLMQRLRASGEDRL